MKISSETVNMLHMSTEFARDAIKMTALANTGAAVYVFSYAPGRNIWFVVGTGCFAVGVISCLVCAIMAYLAQWKYGNAVQCLEKDKLGKYEELQACGHQRRRIGLILMAAAVMFFSIGCSIVALGWAKLF